MTSKKITFYADHDVQQWYESLPKHFGSREINRLLRAAIQKNEPSEQIDDETITRVGRLEENVAELLQANEPTSAVDDDAITTRFDYLEENVAELVEWKQGLPGLAIFEEFESSDIKTGLELIGHYKEELEIHCDVRSALKELKEQVDSLRQRVEPCNR